VGGIVGARFGGNAADEKAKCEKVLTKATKGLDGIVSLNQDILNKLDILKGLCRPADASGIEQGEVLEKLDELSQSVTTINGQIEKDKDALKDEMAMAWPDTQVYV
jgi:hypothetical protein